MLARRGHTAVAGNVSGQHRSCEILRRNNIYENPCLFPLVSDPESPPSLDDIRVGPVRTMADSLRWPFFLSRPPSMTQHTLRIEWFRGFSLVQCVA